MTYTHVAGPRKGGLDVDYETNPKLKTPAPYRDSEQYTKASMIASDGCREFYSDGTARNVFPYELFSHLKENKGRYAFKKGS